MPTLLPCSLRLRTLAALALLAGTAPAHALTYISNLTQFAFSQNPVSTSSWLAEPFITDNSAPSFSLNDYMMSMFNATTASGDFTVSLFSDNSGQPGSPIALGTGTGDPSTTEVYTYTFSSTILQPNTEYWMVASVSSGASSYNAAYVSASDPYAGTWTSTPGWVFSNDQGASWNVAILGISPQFAVDATPTVVPEPATYALLLGLPAFALVYFRRRK